MSIDWDGLVLGPAMSIFGEGSASDPSSWPTYYPKAGGRLRLTDAVFDEQYQRIFTLENGSTTSSSHPVLGVRDALFASVAGGARQGDGVRIPSTGKTYRVTDVQSDGHGHTLLLLVEAAL